MAAAKGGATHGLRIKEEINPSTKTLNEFSSLKFCKMLAILFWILEGRVSSNKPNIAIAKIK